jgi:alkanesulfonate monooxygenase SsuD/methylene tetrahydromethanopterin reductase-like flavin-dependent oxidoreductase (luciferase family)
MADDSIQRPTCRLRFGVHLPNFGPLAEPRALVEIAQAAEDSSWDGVFIWDHIAWEGGHVPVADPLIALAAIATATRRVRIGAMITPVARRRPWKVARECVSLDHLSGGRMIFGAGLGWSAGLEFAPFGEEVDDWARAQQLDEGLAIIDGLWTGRPFSFDGAHYSVRGARFLPRPMQEPRIPVWIGGLWPHRRPFVRAARWDGAFPERLRGGTPTPAEISELVSFIAAHRSSGGAHDVAVGGTSSAHEPLAGYEDYLAAGLTWWLERIDPGEEFSVRATLARVIAGPPVLPT